MTREEAYKELYYVLNKIQQLDNSAATAGMGIKSKIRWIMINLTSQECEIILMYNDIVIKDKTYVNAYPHPDLIEAIRKRVIDENIRNFLEE